MMDAVTEFIKKFHPSNLGLGLWDLLAIAALIIVGLVLGNWIISFFPKPTSDLIRATAKRILSFLSYVLVVLAALNAILIGNYGHVLALVLLAVSTRIDYWYKLYDNFVDKRINRD